MTRHKIFVAFLLMAVLVVPLMAQTLSQLHGDEAYAYRGFYEGNKIRVPFYNDGYIGPRAEVNPDDFKGNWPVGSSLGYINQLAPFVAAEVLDNAGAIRHIVSESNGMAPGHLNAANSADVDEFGHWRCLAPLPGFANDELQQVAMNHKRGTWPPIWPDKMELDNAGWPGSWNGYFGRDQFNADQESYFVIDDYLNSEFPFYPNAMDSSVRGLGLRGFVRGMVWNNILVEDVLFSLYDFENVGTCNHEKMNFGILSGPCIGAPVSALQWPDASDDGGEYDLALDMGWHTDKDWIGWDGSKAGYHGLAFFETPGNPYDGIDNDGDGSMGAGWMIDEAMFAPVTYLVGDPVVLIDYQTFKRTVTQMAADGVEVTYLGKAYRFLPDTPLEEIQNNLIDDNLNGLIDENNGSTLLDENGNVLGSVWLYVGAKCINYFTGEGLSNKLIDERRDDGIDNDDDWDMQKDDTGADGQPLTGDRGEGDGLPTNGEKHFDKTDIGESDMIGLTAFNIFTPWDYYPLYNDEKLWESIIPGFLNARGQYGDTDILMGSGFFPLPAGQTNRFSLGVMFGEDKEDLVRNKKWANEAYENNYEFARAPAVPTLRAVAGDNKVTLFWDEVAEESEDPVLGKDFEGYRIYRSTSDDWGDMPLITDMWASAAFRKPIAQFDLVNGIQGAFPMPVKGVYFDVGTDNGLVHQWTDNTAKNGFDYFYAVTSYDHGDPASGFPPTECSYILSVHADGTVHTGTNVVQVRPEAPAAGFVGPALKGEWLIGSATTGQVTAEIISASEIKDASFHVTFEEAWEETNLGIYPKTISFSWLDVTNPSQADTLINRQPLPGADELLHSSYGIRLYISNDNDNELEIDAVKSAWSNPNIFPYKFAPFRVGTVKGYARPSDYRIDFFEQANVDTSVSFDDSRKIYNPVPVNFKVTNVTEGTQIDFGFNEQDGSDGIFSAFSDLKRKRSDEIYFLEKDATGNQVRTWVFSLTWSTDTTMVLPEAGDYVQIFTYKPFLTNDVYSFSTTAAHVEKKKIAEDMKNIRVVPNPYIVGNAWEPENNFANGRGPRELHFINLPPRCTITIFNVKGQLIAMLEHNEILWNGTTIWDMLSKDKLEIAYGLYIYHVEAPTIGEYVGKFAVIK